MAEPFPRNRGMIRAAALLAAILVAGCGAPSLDQPAAHRSSPASGTLLATWDAPDMRHHVSAVQGDALYVWTNNFATTLQLHRFRGDGNVTALGAPQDGTHWDAAVTEGGRIRLHGFTPLDSFQHEEPPAHRWTRLYDPASDTYGPMEAESEYPVTACTTAEAAVGQGLCWGKTTVSFNGTAFQVDGGSASATMSPANWREAWTVAVPGAVELMSASTQAIVRFDPATGLLEREDARLAFQASSDAAAAWLGGRILVVNPATYDRPGEVWAYRPGGHRPNQPPVARAVVDHFTESVYDPATDSWMGASVTVRDDGSSDPEGGPLDLLWQWDPAHPEIHRAAGPDATAFFQCHGLTFVLVARDDVGGTGNKTLEVPLPPKPFHDAFCDR